MCDRLCIQTENEKKIGMTTQNNQWTLEENHMWLDVNDLSSLT